MSYWDQGRDRRSILRLRWGAAVAGVTTLVLVVVVGTVANNADDCLTRAGYTGDDPFSALAPQECKGVNTASAMLGLLFLLYVLATVVAGIVLGLIAGRRRSAFHGGSVGATVGLGFAVVWAFAAYSIAFGLGRLMPQSQAGRQRELVDRQTTDVARYTHDLCAHLLAGGTPQPLPLSDLAMNEPVYLDTAMGAWRFAGNPADYPRTALTSVGSPLFVGGIDIAAAYGPGAATRAVLPMHASAWVPGGTARVLVTPTGTWCLVNGSWMTIEHRSVVACDVFADAVVLNAAPGYVVLLRSPYAATLAALVTWVRQGREGLASHPLFRTTLPIAPSPAQPPSPAPGPQD